MFFRRDRVGPFVPLHQARRQTNLHKWLLRYASEHRMGGLPPESARPGGVLGIDIDGRQTNLRNKSVGSRREFGQEFVDQRLKFCRLGIGLEQFLNEPLMQVRAGREIGYGDGLAPAFHGVDPLREPAIVFAHPGMQRLKLLRVGQAGFSQEVCRQQGSPWPRRETFVSVHRAPAAVESMAACRSLIEKTFT